MRETLQAILPDQFVSEMYGGEYAIRETRGRHDQSCGSEPHPVYSNKLVTFWRDSETGNVYCLVTDNYKG